MSVGRRIRAAREAKGISGAELARRIGVSKNAVSKWETDKNVPSHDLIAKLGKALDVPALSLSPYGGNSVTPVLESSPTIYVPVLEWAEIDDWAGGVLDMRANQNREYLQADIATSRSTIALRINDESMTPDFRVNDEILIDPEMEPDEGDCILVKMERTGQELFRHYVPRRNGAYDLLAENPEWPTVTVNATNPAVIRGVLSEHRRKRRR